jgi:hypothetical protein
MRFLIGKARHVKALARASLCAQDRLRERPCAGMEIKPDHPSSQGAAAFGDGPNSIAISPPFRAASPRRPCWSMLRAPRAAALLVRSPTMTRRRARGPKHDRSSIRAAVRGNPAARRWAIASRSLSLINNRPLRHPFRRTRHRDPRICWGCRSLELTDTGKSHHGVPARWRSSNR